MTTEALLEEMETKRNEAFSQFKSLVDMPCSHVVCPECTQIFLDNSTKRGLLSTKIAEYDEFINKLKMI